MKDLAFSLPRPVRTDLEGENYYTQGQMESHGYAALHALLRKHTQSFGPKDKKFLMADDLIRDICAQYGLEKY